MKIMVLIVSLTFSMSLMAQSDCKVLAENLQGTYEGKCLNGLAHGKGMAVGEDTYKGKFKEGYPEGKGTIIYADGSTYKGEFKQGRRHGKGNYSMLVEGNKVKKDGFWEDDVYMGPQKAVPYKVKVRRSVERFAISKVGDGNSIKIHLMQNGLNNSSVEDIILYGSSGSEQLISHNIGYSNVEFPFSGKIRYTTANKIKTSRFEVVFEFEILEPGDWKISLYN